MTKSLIQFINKRVLSRFNAEIVGLNRRARPISIDYVPDPRPRYGYGKPPHKLLYLEIDKNRYSYGDLLTQFGKFKDGLSRIRDDETDSSITPFWNNPFVGGTNAVALYCLPAIYESTRYVEIGSGNSTKFVRYSVTQNKLRTHITSIDPAPRAKIDEICDRVVRTSLENADLSLFSNLESGDIVFFDGSHRCLQNSDVTVFFLEILPNLKPGVVIYIDDIYLPYDYPPEWKRRWYSEQYLLATLLLADQGNQYTVLLPHVFIEHDEELARKEKALWQKIGRAGRSGNGFWLRKK